MNDIWSWNNAVDGDGVVLSSSAGSSGELTLANLRDPRVSKKWRAGGSPCQLDITFGYSGGVSVFGLFGVNFPQVGDITLRFGTSVGAGDLWEHTFEPDTLELTDRAVFILSDADGNLDPVSAGYATLLVDSGDPIEIGRLWIGGADWQPEFNHTVRGSSYAGVDLSRRSFTPGSGSPLFDRRARLKSFVANYDMLGPDEYANYLVDMDERGLAQQMLFVPTPDVYSQYKFPILGYLQGDGAPDTAFIGFQRAGRTLTILESG